MKHFFEEPPTGKDNLHGRLLYAARFVNLGHIRGGRVLDIGCGSGWFELFALSTGSAAVVGMEVSFGDLMTAAKYVVDSAAAFVVGNGLQLPFQSASFDTVTAWEVLEHLPTGREVDLFQEVHRVLSPGGHFYLSTPNSSRLSTAFDPAWWLIGHRHYRPSAIRKLAEAAGFRVLSLRTAGGRWEVIHLLNLYVSKWVFRRPPFFARRFEQILDREFARSTGVTNIFVSMATWSRA